MVVTDIDQATGSRVVAQVQKQDGEALFFKMDFNSVDEIEEVFEETIKAFEALDILSTTQPSSVRKGWMRQPRTG